MVHSLERRLAFCSRLAKRTDLRADRGLMEEMFSRIMGGEKAASLSRERLGLLGILCVAFLEVTQVHRCERM